MQLIPLNGAQTDKQAHTQHSMLAEAHTPATMPQDNRHVELKTRPQDTIEEETSSSSVN